MQQNDLNQMASDGSSWWSDKSKWLQGVQGLQEPASMSSKDMIRLFPISTTLPAQYLKHSKSANLCPWVQLMAYARSVPADHKAINQVHWTRVEIKLKSPIFCQWRWDRTNFASPEERHSATYKIFLLVESLYPRCPSHISSRWIRLLINFRKLPKIYQISSWLKMTNFFLLQ